MGKLEFICFFLKFMSMRKSSKHRSFLDIMNKNVWLELTEIHKNLSFLICFHRESAPTSGSFLFCFETPKNIKEKRTSHEWRVF